MADEICIPTDRVPPEILQQLKQIGLLMQSQPPRPSTSSASRFSPSLPLENDDDEGMDDVDGYQASSGFGSVVPVLRSEVTSYENEPMTKNDDEVVSLFDRRPPTPKNNQPFSTKCAKPVPHSSDVVSLFASPAAESQWQNTKQQSHQQSSLGLQKTSVSQTPPGNQPNLTSSDSDVTGQRSSPSPRQGQTSSPFNMPPGHEAALELRQLHSRSPPRTPSKTSRSMSLNESSKASESSLSSISLLRSKSSPSCPNVDDVFRAFPQCPATPSAESGPRTPKMLTPPETPENEGKRVVPEIFTFDDATCARYRQLNEGSQRLPPTPRKLSSTPPNPSCRRPEFPRSPSFSRHLSSMASTSSPQSKKKGCEVPDSPSVFMQQISLQEYPSPAPQRRDSLSPQPKKRLDFEEESVAQAKPRMSYDPSGQPYPRGMENPFLFSSYLHDGGQYEARAGVQSITAWMRELQKKMDFLAAFQEGAGADEEDGNERPIQYASAAYAGGSYEAFDFQGRMTPQAKSFAAKRRRQEPETDGSDDMLMNTCAVMERNFLQMAEGAYTRIRRMGNSTEDFEIFRTELAQTNEILRESMTVLKQIRDFCDRRKRPRW